MANLKRTKSRVKTRPVTERPVAPSVETEPTLTEERVEPTMPTVQIDQTTEAIIPVEESAVTSADTLEAREAHQEATVATPDVVAAQPTPEQTVTESVFEGPPATAIEETVPTDQLITPEKGQFKVAKYMDAQVEALKTAKAFQFKKDALEHALSFALSHPDMFSERERLVYDSLMAFTDEEFAKKGWNHE